MISLEKWLILTPLQKLSKTVGDLSKLIVAKGFKKSPKVQKIAKSGHTDWLWIKRLKPNGRASCVRMKVTKYNLR